MALQGEKKRGKKAKKAKKKEVEAKEAKDQTTRQRGQEKSSEWEISLKEASKAGAKKKNEKENTKGIKGAAMEERANPTSNQRLNDSELSLSR